MRRTRWRCLAGALVVAVVCAARGDEGKPAARGLPPAAERVVDFVRDIQPILAERCHHCHGQDAQEGQLRLDARTIVMRGGQSGPLLVAGKSAKSLLVERVAGIGTEPRMPLDDDPLSDEQIGLVRAWIDQGAKWPDGVGSAATQIDKHWAYVAPRSPPLPQVVGTLCVPSSDHGTRNVPATGGGGTRSVPTWERNAIDRFILARLEREGIAPSPAVEPERLIRRVYLDLVGLPPSPEEVDAVLADRSPDAFERLVDRLLASPRYGERWATPWLDAARYADSNGFQRDGHRTIWPYRDWVAAALNADMPLDQFTIEQLAGDLLPEATREQRIATGFHRCTTVNVEAGTDEEENRVNQVIDRVNVTGTVWLGTTLECCQCHNHKYDPFTQRDYYRLLAFFNNTPKETYQRTKGSAALDFGGPEMTLPADPSDESRRREIAARRSELAAQIEQCVADEESGLAAWLREMAHAERAERARLPANIRRILNLEPDKRNRNQQNHLRTHFIGQHAEAKVMQKEMDSLQQQFDALAPPATLVMAEMDQPRTTAILKRGNFLDPGEEVQPGTPWILPPPAAEPANRLDLARWLVDPANPLTPRVQVNRAWSQFFGRGIVGTEEDFGTQAEPPTHPELLDWLAVELRDRGWSMKHIHRRIVESATYRQSSRYRTDLAARDPNNVLLARGPRQRLTAEAIRDNGLAISGLLSSKLGGPPVYPPQPEGIWRVTGLVDNTYRTSEGDDRYRRGLYTVRRRSAPYPSFAAFDASDRSACTVKRRDSNSPLQALVLMNDPAYVEMAHTLAERVLAETADQPLDAQLTHAFRLVLSRRPHDAELSHLHTIFEQARQRRAAGDAGESDTDRAAWFDVAHVLLNLDEAITKP